MQLDRELALAWRDLSIKLAMKAIEAGTGASVVQTEQWNPEDLEMEPQA